MKEMCFPILNGLYQKIAYELQQQDYLHQRHTNEQIEKLKMFKITLERIFCFLGLNKHDIQPAHKEKLLLVEKHINFFLSPFQRRKPTSSPVQEQLPQSSMQLQQPQSLDGQTNPSMQPVQGTMEAPTRNANEVDWQEEVYLKIKSMKEMYFSKLDNLYQKIAYELQHDSLHQHRTNEQIEKLKMFKVTLERIMLFLRLNKQDIQLSHKEKLVSVEKHISFFLSSNRPRSKPSSSPLQGQLPQSSMQLQQPQSLDGQTNPSIQPILANLGSLQQNSNTLQQTLPKQRELQILQKQQLRQLYHHRQMQQQPFQRQQLMKQQRKQQMLQNQQLISGVVPSADAAATFSKTEVNATAASKATVDHAIANPPDVTASTIFHAASATTIS